MQLRTTLLKKMKMLIVVFLLQGYFMTLQAQESKPLNVSNPGSLRDSISLQGTLPSKPEFSQSYTKPFGLEQNRINIDFGLEKESFKSIYPRLIAPIAFVSYGIMAQENHAMKNLDKSTGYEVGEHFTHSMTYDNYLQFAPGIAVYGLNIAGIKGRHNLKDVTVVMATSHLLMAGAVNILKNTTNVLRPDDSSWNSFPSGHTATSFVGAHILFREYIGISPYLAFSGYLVSSATGTLRVLNKRHWVSDVFMGAGIGMLSVEAGYFLLPVINSVLYPNASKTQKRLAIAPSIGENNYGLGMVYVF